jgi:hypothetical protein
VAIDSTDSAEKLVRRQPCAPDQGSQRSACDVIMIGHRQSGNLAGFGQDDVAASLPGDAPAEVFERSHDL